MGFHYLYDEHIYRYDDDDYTMYQGYRIINEKRITVSTKKYILRVEDDYLTVYKRTNYDNSGLNWCGTTYSYRIIHFILTFRAFYKEYDKK